ncbi:hypothetical protein [Pseudooceanicola lipolyticus]|uniref:hypothetical protein n=1 Tax=Pseudooceanicola lipolyticus TaxID=2029104 RepID=UPI001055AEA2|nr:hypothetical protein [Pseudooceanicola lipolyticus]
MNNPMTRRAALCAAPAILTPIATLVSAATEPDDPVLPHYRAWLAARADWLRAAELPGNGNLEHPDSREAELREQQALELMIETPPTSLAGIAALVFIFWDWEGPSSLNAARFEEECQLLPNKLLLAIWKATSGQNGAPERLTGGAA